jgi:hypothetical protein
MADAVKKGALSGWSSNIDQDQEQTRDLDSRNHQPGFVQFLIPQDAVTFRVNGSERKPAVPDHKHSDLPHNAGDTRPF